LNKWFKKFPYLGWIIIFVISLLACALLYRYEQRQYTAPVLSASVQDYFRRMEAAIERDAEAGLFRFDTATAEMPALSGDYFLFLVQAGNTLFWNTNKVDLPASVKQAPDSFLSGRLLRLSNGYYYIRSFAADNRSEGARTYALTLVPLLYEYAIENKYFRAYFVADGKIPTTTEIVAANGKGAYPVLDQKGRPVFYLSFIEPPELTYIAGPRVWLLALIACFSLACWIHETCYGLGQRFRKPFWGWVLLLLFREAFLYCNASVKYPVGFLNAHLFSPELFSSGERILSLGHFMIETLFAAWLLLYLIAYVPMSKRRLVRNRWMDIVIRLLLVFFLVSSLYRSVADDMHKLVIDSKISFEVGDFRNLTRYTFAGIFTLSVITVSFLVMLGIINNLLQKVVHRLPWKLMIVAGMSLVTIYLLSNEELNAFYIATMCMAVAGLLLIDAFGLPLQGRSRQYDLSIAPTTYIWFAILCSWITLEIFYFNFSKERELRKVFAQKQQQKDDEYVKYTFMDFAEHFREDTLVSGYLGRPDSLLRRQTDKHILYDHLTEYTRKYSIGLYYYNRQRQPLHPLDTVDRRLIAIADSLNGSPFTFGVQNVERFTGGRHIYWCMCPILNRAGTDTIGYVGFDVALDKSPKLLAQRSFLQKQQNPTDQQYYDNYAYGIYRNNSLWTQDGDYIFPYHRQQARTPAEFTFYESLQESRLLYRAPNEELIEVIYRRNLLTNIVSLFSYVLAVLLVFTAFVFLLRQSLFYPARFRVFFRNFNFTIRSKVNLTILVTVFASLFAVGVITLSFLNNRYKENQRKNLQSLVLYYTQSILQFSEENQWDFRNDGPANPLSRYSDLSYRLNRLAEQQGADINLYNSNGKLVATSQLELLAKNLLSRYMQPDVLAALRTGVHSELIAAEHIGDLEYQSVYIPLRSKKDDRIFLYVNLPYYASQTELKGEISNVLVSLINVYTLIFFISGICAILISNSIIRSFRLLIDQFRNIRLRHNEYIEWPYKDELGILVKEYNTMMHKVEDMASKLARTEREAAWREIARQVAHEIKNPLTPMKLSIQYLQQAIKSGRPDIEELASRVSVTLIEQIENLNLIASEFSNFAKMPEAAPELLNLQQSLESIVLLFHKDNETAVMLKKGDPGLYVYMDKSYFIRIFTNLIQNAIQSVDKDRDGLVVIDYEQKEKQVVISVRDNGSGIPEELQEKLFVPYFTTKSSGTGLGLPMTKSMVEHSDGKVWFTTGSEGSVFYVQLPLADRTDPVV